MRSLSPKGLRVGLFMVGLLALAPSGASADANLPPDVWVWGTERWETSTTGDRIDANVPRYGERDYCLSLEVKTGSVAGASAAITLPNAFEYWYYDRSPMYVKWDDANRVFTWTAVGPVPSGSGIHMSIDPATKLAYEVPAVTVSRTISNPVFSDPNNVEQRIVTVTLNVPAGALSAYNTLEVNIVREWDMPPGITVKSFTEANLPAPFFKPTGVTASYPLYVAYDPNGLTGLAGSYSFAVPVEFAREGDMKQGSLGDLYFNPPSAVTYREQVSLSPVTGNSLSVSLDADSNATFLTSNTVNFDGWAGAPTKELKFEAVAAANNSAPFVGEIDLVKLKRRTISGDTIYHLFVEANGVNFVSGTVTTPSDTKYEMTLDVERGRLSLERGSADPNELAEFGTGNYTIKIRGADPNSEKTYVIALVGDYPTEFPVFDQAMGFEANVVRPTISWALPGDPNIIKTRAAIDYVDYERGVFVDPNVVSFTAPEDMPVGGAGASVAFCNGVMGDANGAGYLAGFATDSLLYFNVVPEPGIMGLLGVGAAGLILRRRKR